MTEVADSTGQRSSGAVETSLLGAALRFVPCVTVMCLYRNWMYSFENQNNLPSFQLILLAPLRTHSIFIFLHSLEAPLDRKDGSTVSMILNIFGKYCPQTELRGIVWIIFITFVFPVSVRFIQYFLIGILTLFIKLINRLVLALYHSNIFIK